MRPALARASRLRFAASQASRTAGVAAARSRPLSSAAADVDVVVCGAGVVGVACAHYLAVRGARVTLIDERPALSYTSALSTECYRNWWGADPTMTAFMDRSIDLNPNPCPNRNPDPDPGLTLALNLTLALTLTLTLILTRTAASTCSNSSPTPRTTASP